MKEWLQFESCVSGFVLRTIHTHLIKPYLTAGWWQSPSSVDKLQEPSCIAASSGGEASLKILSSLNLESPLDPL